MGWLQTLSLSCCDARLELFVSISICRGSLETSMSLDREGDSRDRSDNLWYETVSLGIIGCQSLKIGKSNQGKVGERSEFVSSSVS